MEVILYYVEKCIKPKEDTCIHVVLHPVSVGVLASNDIPVG